MANLFRNSVRYYLENISSVLGFALLLIFVIFFLNFSGVFVSSGSVFFDYSAIEDIGPDFLLFLAGLLVFLFFYSMFVILMVFSVRNYLSQVKLHYYLADKIRKFALKYFVFLVAMTVLSFLVSYFFSFIVFSKILGFVALAILFSLFLFLPQSIVIDEESLYSSIQNNIEFSMKNLQTVALVFVAGLLLFYAVVLLEFALNSFFIPGEFLSLLLTVLFIVPFIEAVKTAYYMQKFGLVKRTSLAFS